MKRVVKKEVKHLWFLLAVIIAIPIVWAVATTTQVNFNIANVVGYTLTLPGEGAVSATGGAGAPTTAIEFNSTTGTDVDVEAGVVGGTAQSDGVPIFQFDNTGTVDINLTAFFNQSLPGCIDVYGGFPFNNESNWTVMSESNITIATNYGPSEPVTDFYIRANFTGCGAGDSANRILRTDGVQS